MSNSDNDPDVVSGLTDEASGQPEKLDVFQRAAGEFGRIEEALAHAMEAVRAERTHPSHWEKAKSIVDGLADKSQTHGEEYG